MFSNKQGQPWMVDISLSEDSSNVSEDDGVISTDELDLDAVIFDEVIGSNSQDISKGDLEYDSDSSAGSEATLTNENQGNISEDDSDETITPENVNYNNHFSSFSSTDGSDIDASFNYYLNLFGDNLHDSDNILSGEETDSIRENSQKKRVSFREPLCDEKSFEHDVNEFVSYEVPEQVADQTDIQIYDVEDGDVMFDDGFVVKDIPQDSVGDSYNLSVSFTESKSLDNEILGKGDEVNKDTHGSNNDGFVEKKVVKRYTSSSYNLSLALAELKQRRSAEMINKMEKAKEESEKNSSVKSVTYQYKNPVQFTSEISENDKQNSDDDLDGFVEKQVSGNTEDSNYNLSIEYAGSNKKRAVPKLEDMETVSEAQLDSETNLRFSGYKGSPSHKRKLSLLYRPVKRVKKNSTGSLRSNLKSMPTQDICDSATYNYFDMKKKSLTDNEPLDLSKSSNINLTENSISKSDEFDPFENTEISLSNNDKNEEITAPIHIEDIVLSNDIQQESTFNSEKRVASPELDKPIKETRSSSIFSFRRKSSTTSKNSDKRRKPMLDYFVGFIGTFICCYANPSSYFTNL